MGCKVGCKVVAKLQSWAKSRAKRADVDPQQVAKLPQKVAKLAYRCKVVAKLKLNFATHFCLEYLL